MNTAEPAPLCAKRVNPRTLSPGSSEAIDFTAIVSVKLADCFTKSPSQLSEPLSRLLSVASELEPYYYN